MLASLDCFGSDLNLVQRRYRHLADAPRLSDADRLPPRSVVNDMPAFNRAYWQHLESRQSVDLHRLWDVREAMVETDDLYRVWDAVRDARCEHYYVTVRREALRRLREALGREAYHTAALPPHVPVWRFQPIE